MSYHDSGCPPAFDDVKLSSSATRCKTSDDFPTSVRPDCVDYPKLLPIGQLKLTNKWPAPSTLKYLAISAYPSPPVLSLEHGQGSISPHSGRWSPSKIWLLVSCMTVFAYGTTFLLWASVTWFDGEHSLALRVRFKKTHDVCSQPGPMPMSWLLPTTTSLS